MTPLPDDPHESLLVELTMSDGRKVKLNAPGLTPRARPRVSAERGAPEPPRDDPRPPIDVNLGQGG